MKVWKRQLETAGAAFVGTYMGRILKVEKKLRTDNEFKKRFINEIYSEWGRDENIGGTRTRVNAVLKIIYNNCVEESLAYVINSSRVIKKDYEAVRAAKNTLKRA